VGQPSPADDASNADVGGYFLSVNNGDAMMPALIAPEGPLPKRVEVLRDYLIEKLTRAAVAEDHGRAAS
jgi:hypothetical protein